MRRDDNLSHVPHRGPESVDESKDWRPFASHQQRRRSDHLGVGARERRRFSLIVAHAFSTASKACYLPLLSASSAIAARGVLFRSREKPSLLGSHPPGGLPFSAICAKPLVPS
jgi:hypothetical protein